MLRWRISILVSVAIAISYLDRQTLPLAIEEIKSQSGIRITDQQFALLNTAFLATYGLMYLGGGRLMDWMGTRRGLAVIMIFWSIACASHGIASTLMMLVISRLLLGIGEGGGFPAGSRAVAEWFPVKERSTAMGIINAGTAIGGIAAPPLIALILTYGDWFGINSWRWIFFLTGAFGIAWTFWWMIDYYPPQQHKSLNSKEREYITAGASANDDTAPAIRLSALLRHRQTWGIVIAKFLSDAAWYFILFWLPKYLKTEHHFDIKGVGSVAWIPHAAAGVGCLIGGGLSSFLLKKNFSLNISRKTALGASAILMPLLMLVPQVPVFWVIVLFSIGYFGQQSWSTLVMTLPADLFPKRAVGTVAGLVGLGGAMGGIAFGQLAGYLLDHGYGYSPVLIIAGSLHITAFIILLAMVPSIEPVPVSSYPISKETLR